MSVLNALKLKNSYISWRKYVIQKKIDKKKKIDILNTLKMKERMTKIEVLLYYYRNLLKIKN